MHLYIFSPVRGLDGLCQQRLCRSVPTSFSTVHEIFTFVAKNNITNNEAIVLETMDVSKPSEIRDYLYKFPEKPDPDEVKNQLGTC